MAILSGTNLLSHNSYGFITFSFLLFFFGFNNTGRGQIAQRGTATSATTTNTTLTISRPTGVVAGDLLIANITQTGNTITNASRTGWTIIDGALQSTGAPRRSTILYRITDGTEGSSFAFTLGSGTSSAVGAIIAFSGVDASVFDVTPGTLNVGAGTTITAAGITTTTNNAAVVFITGAGGTDGDIYSNWSGSTPTFSGIMNFSTTTINNSVGAAWGILSTAGATGNKTVTVDGNYYWAGMLIALRPAPVSSYIFSTPGPSTFTVPAGIRKITVEAWGGGGRGGSAIQNGQSRAGGGGGGGAYSRKIISVTPVNTYDLVVGAGGNSDANLNGGDTYFINTSTIVAKGGNGVATNNLTGGSGGIFTTGDGDSGYSGGNGATAVLNSYSGGGGSSAGISSAGANGSAQNGGTAPTGGGNGGNGGTANPTTGGDGSNPGGGGGGAKKGTGNASPIGGSGAPGQVIITWACPSITLTSGSSTPTVCVNTAITNIVYTIGDNYGAANVTGLPTGVTYNIAGNTLTISGTPSVTAGSPYNYTITLTKPTGCSSDGVTGGTITVDPLPTAYNIIGGGAYCAGGSGVAVGLDNSQTGVNYQLYNGASTVGSPVAGTTGSAINFGSQTAAGSYTVRATNTTTLCEQNMSGNVSITINPLPTAYNVTGGGNYCAGGPGVSVGIDNSQTGVNYQLYNGASTVGSPVAGTNGSAISFGSQTAAGSYTVRATNTTTLCEQNMSGNVLITINPLPAPNLTPTGTEACANDDVVYTTEASQASYVWAMPGSILNTDYTVTAGGTATDNSITLKWITAGSKAVSVNYTNANGCTAASATTSTITVHPIPAIGTFE